MKEKIKSLKQKLIDLAEVQVSIDEKKTAYELSIADDVSKVSSLNAEITKLKTEINDLAVADFKLNKNKSLYGGIGIQEKNIMKYDLEKAKLWAVEKKLFMVFDEKTFEKTVDEKSIESLGINFITFSKEPKATFPKEIKLND